MGVDIKPYNNIVHGIYCSAYLLQSFTISGLYIGKVKIIFFLFFIALAFTKLFQGFVNL